MHLLLLGASGRTGQHVVSELLSQGHTAVALVRTSGSLTPRPGRLANVNYALEDYGLVDKDIRLTKMHWTLVRAVRLQFDDQKPTDAKTNVRMLGSKGGGMSVADSLSIASVASFLVKVAVEGLFGQSAVVVAN
ncbi:hypothetical protein LARI1_G006107 [Lachnellula arida]|uniref:NAD(P)-binding domain-containing protein n=1 Tax=Lachnellula arida TaxID=1316785 RepID=A0A8T9BBP9_9HELO|nr:hypothetical protein LARI1_G006107 [Lachnellula arida]